MNKVLANRNKFTDKKVAIILGILAFLVYSFSHRGEGSHWNYFILLSDAFLHGRLNVIDHPSWLNELILWQGEYYVVYPPMPAILLTPFVAIFGKDFYQPILSWIIGGLNVSLCFLVLRKKFSTKISLWTSLLYAFGTMQWFHAEVGSVWYMAHIVAMFFIWLMLWESFSKQRLFLIGTFLGMAYLSRLPAILAITFIVLYFYKKFISKNYIEVTQNITKLLAGILPFILLNFSYNFLRFGVIYDISYTLLPVHNEPWYRFGIFSIKYIPIHLMEIFTSLPKISIQPPFVIPSLNVMALWFVTPAFVLLLRANYKKFINVVVLTAVIIMSFPALMHGENGFTQFGFRFFLDLMPFLILLVAAGIKEIDWKVKLLIFVSVLINLWGVIMISFLNLWVL